MTDTEINKDVVPDQEEATEPVEQENPVTGTKVEDTSETDAFFNTTVPMSGAPEASPDGAWLAFLKPDEYGALELWIAPTDGGEPRQIPVPFVPVEDVNPETGRIVRGPQWSPDGATLALTGLRPEGDRTAVWLVPTGVSPATDDAESVDPPEPESEATQDNVQAATPAKEETSTSSGDAGADVPEGMPEPLPKLDADETPADAVVAETPKPRMLVDHPGSDRSPRWSLDGTIIAMTSTIDGRDVIALAPVGDEDDSAIELLTWSQSNDREAVWSRDGKYLAFLRQRPDGVEHADVFCYSLETGELKNLTSEKATAMRHSLEWVPGRNLIAYVTEDSDWLSISVINADNKAGWTVTRESGDKTQPRFAPDEARLVYVRTEGFTTVMCERSLHASSAVALDPGEGVVHYPRWLASKRVAYGFSAPQRPFGFLVQDNLADAERTPITLPGTPSITGHPLQHPQPFEFSVGPDEQFSGMLYRTAGVAGKAPAIVYLPDGPLTTRRGEFQMQEQALASTALTVLTPVIHGTSGFGLALENDLREFADTELEVNDLAEAGLALGQEEGIASDKLALVGNGFGGTLALLTGGARPGVYSAIVAIDPITEWSVELGNCDVPWRNWVTGRFGMPLTDADVYTLRTPMTFSAVIDVPVLLVRTPSAPAYRRMQMDLLIADFEEMGVVYEVYDASEETLPGTLRAISKRLAQQFLGGAEQAEVVSDLHAEDL
ncbi:MAG TPA: prolyl oligopeptidase family serine peptidase [Thermomicrobiales bacterium]|nr:prolyl oligopeptidase family serine peptidase [Thermomicrobiales bacterium]